MNYRKEQLNEISIYDLRAFARKIGVKSPSSMIKRNLIEEIIKVENGEKAPDFSGKRGRPPKRKLLPEIPEDEEFILDIDGGEIWKKVKAKLISAILKDIEKKLNEIL